jgi:diguanylate cyclase (GGDEF)-like protein
MTSIPPPQASHRQTVPTDAQPARPNAEDDLRRLGQALRARTDEVLKGMSCRTETHGRPLDPIVEERLQRVGEVSTIAVSSWMAGEDPQVAREIGQESWLIFSELAVQRAAPPSELTKRCLGWCSAAEEVVGEIASELQTPPEISAQALAMLRRSLSVTLVRMCEACEAERTRADEEHTQYEQELEFMATHDELTKLPNRALIIDRLEQMLVRSRHSHLPVAALFIDLDEFKSVNDTLGHDAGDELLRAVAARFTEVVRDVDALGRLGGDEFVLVATGASLSSGAEALAERLLAALEEPFRVGHAQTLVTVTASIGIEVGQDTSAGDLLRDADVAMYRAKWAGGNRCFMFKDGPRSCDRRAPKRRWDRLPRIGLRRRADMRLNER